MTGEMAGMGFAGIDHAFELGVREIAVGNHVLGKMGPVVGLRRSNRRHGDGLDKLVGMRLGVGDADCPELIGLVDAVGGLQARRWRRIPQLVGELDDLAIGWRGRR